ncbi:hypothetical protein P7K49_000525 [Saguinus oedipus]|uniref:Uncharacterized protein n=1 Tax=Saguinus oedipus TaxID=9490 RepID=A0ABQ9WDM4_SAGOE|nr:hypothetical protein P7K49_000525 [Saguinus oedipus]
MCSTRHRASETTPFRAHAHCGQQPPGHCTPQNTGVMGCGPLGGFPRAELETTSVLGIGLQSEPSLPRPWVAWEEVAMSLCSGT